MHDAVVTPPPPVNEPILGYAPGSAEKARLKAECAHASEIGVIGAPCLVTADGEVFWGNDRLEQGLDWAAHPGGAA